ncbi:hypothetical protein ABZ671_16925 [Micromonospora sp. NPDC006766]|uniref:hypothetical protein n=1 Tax=Micromonospora sp. NPDC006766 TaxID=3154778 RepID=UPI0033CA7DD3
MRGTIRKSKPAQALLLTTAAVAATLGVATTPAQASSASCTAPYFYWGWYRTCTTGSISANSTYHFVDVRVYACVGSPWKVWDTKTGVTVASGKGPGQSKGTTVKRINGLYGSSYKAKLSDACANDKITITNNV